jgi:hypothetical protein
MDRIRQLEETVVKLERRIAALEARLGVSPERKTERPVNRIAYEKAFLARENGDRTAMRRYLEFYRIPS